ncbi:lantibiotic dehydratase [Archangium violaceum]|uniref:lantibiotic dehydratase n=1 Tax=Archangium violaceum TaxID=83451 RepID=UPI001EF5D938|nr:lantibiotic dehydratase [Archangium violaceum]
MGERPGVRPAGFFVLRTPLLPHDVLREWSTGAGDSGAPGGDDATLEAALATDRRRTRERLREVVTRPEVREALFLASPSLEESLGTWWEAPESERGQKVERTLVRYLSRMAGRATPFGLFAGCTMGELGARTRLVLGPLEEARRHTRLDMDYLFSLTETLASRPEWRRGLRFRPNSSLYRVAGRLRYAEARREGQARDYHLVAVEPTLYLEATLARAARGASLEELTAALCEADAEVPREEAEAYVEALADAQLLVPELSPTVTGPEPIHEVLTQLRQLPGGEPLVERLEQARATLESLDGQGLGVHPRRYREVAERLEALPARPALPRLFQVDLVRPASEAVLGEAVVKEVVRGVELLRRLVPARGGGEALRRFRDAFLARYEGQEVPLVEALDEESGLGFGGISDEAEPLLRGLAFPGRAQEKHWSERHAHLLRRWEETLRAGRRELALTEEDERALAVESPLPLPDAFEVLAAVAAPSEEALAEGHFRLHLASVGGPPGARLLGRFCHADAKLEEAIRKHLREEEALRPGVCFAEVVHLPEGRVGNVLLRPVLRDHEIAYLGRSGAPRERQVPMTDLRVSVVGNRVVLRSERLGCEVLPRLTTAHHYGGRSLGLYRFLCSLQGQGVAGSLGWEWGPLEEAAFLPRVTAGRLVLSLARWRVEPAEVERLEGLSGVARHREVRRWRERRGIPRHVGLSEGDNVLPLDLEGELWVDTFLQLAKGHETVTLVEPFPGGHELCVRGPEGRYVHELVLPFTRARPETPRARAPQDSRPAEPARIRRRFTPGSEWLYAKLYGGSASADRVLREAVGPLVREAMGAGMADGWFFIRYDDPEPHLRVRLHGDARRLTGEVLPALEARMEPLLEEGLLWRVQLDTYEREVERYGGGEGVRLAERLFHADSEAVLSILEGLSGDEGAETRWLLALKGVTLLLEDLGLEAETRHGVLSRAREALGREMRVEADFTHQLGARYRQERARVEAVLRGSGTEDGPLSAGLAALEKRSRVLEPITAELRGCAMEGRLGVPLEELAWSFLHMHANRLLRSSARRQELVLYDFLLRHLESMKARRRT